MKKLISTFSSLPATAWRVWLEYWRLLWVRVVLMGALALLSLGLAQLVGHLLPDELASYVSGKAADKLLGIIANAMLAVTTFSLTVMVSVYQSSSSQFTPRIHRLIVQDATTQNTLAAFIGAYVYALTGIILRELGIFTDDRAFLLFAMTVLVLIYVVVSMVRWVLHLQTYGSLTNTSRQIEEITRTQFSERLSKPCLGANPWLSSENAPESATPVYSDETGYVQHFYQESLDAKAKALGMHVYLAAHVGSFVMAGEVLAYIDDRGDGDGEPEDERDCEEIIRAHIKQGDTRTYDQDPRFGLMVLGEIASKALSPGINDPGTAIDIITRQARILSEYEDETACEARVIHTRLWVQPLTPEDLIEDAFGSLARDGAGVVEVQQRLQKALTSLTRHSCPEMAEAAEKAALIEYARGVGALDFDHDRTRLRNATAPSVVEAYEA